MNDRDVTDDRLLAAGVFTDWLSAMQRALQGESESDVPCDGCTACCRASQFVHIGPDEVETLGRIPADLLFPAPRMPSGNLVLGYDEHGHCPLLVDDRCSVYEQRPRACRTYDCRVLPAAGVEIDEETKLGITRQARRWRFAYSDEMDRVYRDAVRAAARFVHQRGDLLPERVAPANATQHAVLAIRLHDVFLRQDDETGRTVIVDPDPQAVDEAVRIRLGG